MRITESARRVYIYDEPVNMGRSFKGLSQIIEEKLDKDPKSGDMFLFVSKLGSYIKILFYANRGVCILAKKVPVGRFVIPARKSITTDLMEEILNDESFLDIPAESVSAAF